MKKLLIFAFTLITIVFAGAISASANILEFGDLAEFTINADDSSADTFSVTVGGNPQAVGTTFNYVENSGDVVITPKQGYRIKEVRMDEGLVAIWNSETPATEEQIEHEKFDAVTTDELMNERIRDNFFQKNDDGTIDFNGPFIMTQALLTKDPYVGWHFDEIIFFADELAVPQKGIVTMTVTTEIIPVNDIIIKELNQPDFVDYIYNDQIYKSIQALQDAINEDIHTHKILSGTRIRIDGIALASAVNTYTWPTYQAVTGLSRNFVSLLILGEHELVVFIIYPKDSKGVIVPIHTLPIPDPTPSAEPGENNQNDFGQYVKSVTVTSNESGKLEETQSFDTYDAFNDYLKTLYVGTPVDLTFVFKDEKYVINDVSTGNISADGLTVSNVVLTGDTLKMINDGANGVPTPAGTWLGETFEGENAEGHYKPETVTWNQEYNEGEALTLNLTIGEPKPRAAIAVIKASSGFGDNEPGVLAVTYAAFADLITKEDNAKITINGYLENSTYPGFEDFKDNPDAVKLPEQTFDIDAENYYWGYWFNPANGIDFNYEYTFVISAVLDVGENSTEATERITIGSGTIFGSD